MRVLFASSEVFPLVKTGGLGDVSSALPAALAAAGDEVRVLLPGYPAALAATRDRRELARLGDPFGVGEVVLVEGKAPDTGVTLWLLDCPALYTRDGGPYSDLAGRDWPDNGLRFGLLSWAAAMLTTDRSPVAWRPQILHCNDWQTGLAPAWLQAWGNPGRVGTVFTIHNLAYQGRFSADLVGQLGLPPEMYAPEGLEYYETLSFLKAGIYYADRLTTVSPRYAREIQTPAFGYGMEGLLAWRSQVLTGILNGADYQVWNPATDRHLSLPFTPGNAAGKAANKASLLNELGLQAQPHTPLMVVVTRLTEQKGMDLLLSVLPTIVGLGAQIGVIGTGDRALEQAFLAAAAAHPDQVAVHIGYSEPLAHRLIAGGDMLLMPSRFEPCGLTQLYAFRYGTVPIGHAVGGLADTLVDTGYDTLLNGTANAFVFEHSNAGAFQWAIERAVTLYRDQERWRRIIDAGLVQDFSWSRAAQRYQELYATLAAERGQSRG